jgi:hypothetical protein
MIFTPHYDGDVQQRRGGILDSSSEASVEGRRCELGQEVGDRARGGSGRIPHARRAPQAAHHGACRLQVRIWPVRDMRRKK